MKLVNAENIIETDRLRLEPILPSHAMKLFNHLKSEILYKYIPQDPPNSVEDLQRRYALWGARQSEDGNELWLNYAIYNIECSDYVGTIQATLQKSGKTYIAYEVFPNFWRKGIAKEACGVLIRHLFDDYSVHSITAHVDTRNMASWKLLESLGFQKTETLIGADQFKGAVSDEFVYCYLNDA